MIYYEDELAKENYLSFRQYSSKSSDEGASKGLRHSKLMEGSLKYAQSASYQVLPRLSN